MVCKKSFNSACVQRKRGWEDFNQKWIKETFLVDYFILLINKGAQQWDFRLRFLHHLILPEKEIWKLKISTWFFEGGPDIQEFVRFTFVHIIRTLTLCVCSVCASCSYLYAHSVYRYIGRMLSKFWWNIENSRKDMNEPLRVSMHPLKP